VSARVEREYGVVGEGFDQKPKPQFSFHKSLEPLTAPRLSARQIAVPLHAPQPLLSAAEKSRGTALEATLGSDLQKPDARSRS